MSVMDSCLSTDLILHRIISKLNLREKFAAQGVCRQWRDNAVACLQQHEWLVISESGPNDFYCYDICPDHIDVSIDNLIWAKQSDIEFWKRTLPLLSGVKYAYIDLRPSDGGDWQYEAYSPIIQLLVKSCGQSLECLCIPDYSDREEEDHSFPFTDSLPRVKHVFQSHTKGKVTRNILTACPSLELLRSCTDFTDWKMLPKGFKRLDCDCEDFEGIIGLLSSPAASTLEVVRGIRMTGEVCYKPYHLSSLKKFNTWIDFNVTESLLHLVRILSFAPFLQELSINIGVFDEIESQTWIKVLSHCPNVSKLWVYLLGADDELDLKIKVSSFQDDFAKTIASHVKKLEHLYIDFHLSSDGLQSLEKLENLEYFHHKIYTENMSYDSVFDTDALTHFLSSSLDKKLKDYNIDIPEANSFGEYLILKESFFDFVEKMEKKHNLIQFYVRMLDRHLDKERTHPDKIPGMIYVTDLYVKEWNFICPYIEDDDKDDTENLLIAVTDTQSHVQDILLGNE